MDEDILAYPGSKIISGPRFVLEISRKTIQYIKNYSKQYLSWGLRSGFDSSDTVMICRLH